MAKAKDTGNEFDGKDTAVLYAEYKKLTSEHGPRQARMQALRDELVRREHATGQPAGGAS